MNLKMNILNVFYFVKFLLYLINIKLRKDDNLMKKYEIWVFMGLYKGSKGFIFWLVLFLLDVKF